MRAVTVLLIAALGLAGCDRITGEADRKMYDAEAIGYACRVSLKPPEDCMKENEAYSPTSILSGWKAADKAIKEGIIDPSMGKRQAMPPQPVAPAPAAAPAEPKPAEAAAPKASEATKPAPAAKPAPAH
jgi:hypothetical protein